MARKATTPKPQDAAGEDTPDRRKAFALEYIIDLNGAQAAIRAGYSPRTAKSQAHRLLTKDDVQAWIQEGFAARSKRTEITADRVVQEMAKIGFASMRQFISIDADGQPQINLTDTEADALDALSEVSTETVLEGEDGTRVRKTKIKLHDKLRALQALAEHTGVYDKRDKNQANALANAFADIWARGSKAPIRKDGES